MPRLIMGCCCCPSGGHGIDADGKELSTGDVGHEIAVKRRCRDVLFLLLFMAFWVGMISVCAVAISKGNYRRLLYGYDSYGFLCGADNRGQLGGDEGPDLREYKKLYYLNPLELLDREKYETAKRICVKECPTIDQKCNLTIGTNPACANASSYKCPYYRVVEKAIYGRLPTVDTWSTDYFDKLDTLNETGYDCDLGVAGGVMTAVGGNSSVCGIQLQSESLIPDAGPCYPIWTETVDYLNRCFPKLDENTQSILTSFRPDMTLSGSASVVKDEFGGMGERVQRYVADIAKGWIIIVIGGLLTGLVVSMTWLVILRYFAGVMAWLTVIGVNVGFIGCTFFALARSGRLGEMGGVGASLSDQIPEDEDPTERERAIWFSVSIAGAVGTGIILLLTLVMFKRIRIAIAIIKVACQAIKTMPTLLLFPIIPFIMEVAVVVYFIYVSAMLYSAGDLVPRYQPEPSLNDILNDASLSDSPGPTDTPEAMESETEVDVSREACAMNPECSFVIEWNQKLMYMFLYHLFGLLWTNFFIVGIGYVVTAGAVANFYWTSGSGGHKSVRKSFHNAFRYHLGSIALGSLIAAIVQFLRLMLEYAHRRLKKMIERGNQVVQYVICCLRTFLWMLEWIVRFINRNAYIMVAVKGSSYCQSAGRAVSLLISNALRLVAVNVIGDVLLWLGKLGVMGSCGIVAFLLSGMKRYSDAVEHPDSCLSSPLMPILIAMGVGYVVADLFFEVFEMTIDTVLLCFCEDCERHDGSPRYAPALLMAAIERSKRFHSQAAPSVEKG